MSQADVNVVKRFVEAGLAGDAEAAIGLIHPDGRFEEAGSLPHYGGTHVGPEGVAVLLGQIFKLYEIALDDLEFIDCGSFVLFKAMVTFTARTNGRSLRMPVVELHDIADGRIRRNQIYYQDTKALIDLGASL
jgi:uncharacterized protein